MSKKPNRAQKRICPVCKKKPVQREDPFFPFCSDRCKLIDLGRWATEQYRVPGEPVKKEEEPDDEN